MEHHAYTKPSKQRVLCYTLLLTFSFLIVEVIGSFLTGSLALLSDATHMFTDVTALAIALVALRIGQRPADNRHTYGYQRFEILAAAFNAVLLFLVALYILYEAYQRSYQPQALQSIGMLIIAIGGLVINFISLRLLHSNKDSSLNLKGAYLEVWSDMLSSFGVLIGAILIQWFHWFWIDSLIAILIGLWVLPRTWVLLKESINILLEGVPSNLNPDHIIHALQTYPGVIDIHDLHVWAITSHNVMMTAHIFIAPDTNTEQILAGLKNILAAQFHIHHATLQLELAACGISKHCLPAKY